MKNLSFVARVLIFLVINFTALAIGGWLQGEGPASAWYQSLNTAPWTPPGWFFGVAWTTIMICFAIYMARLIAAKDTGQTYLLFGIQFLLNTAWNPSFFRFQLVGLALVIILALTLLMAYFLFQYSRKLPAWKWLVLPYVVWLVVASSLNAYVLLNN